MVLRTRHGLTGAILVLGLSSASCATRTPAQVTLAPAPVTAVAPALPAPAPQLQSQPKPDPVAELIALSNRHFEAGQRELQLGHLEMAKASFNKALEVLLESPYGARTEPSLRQQFDRLVERISAYEATALAQGDGFTEQKQYESATIDDLLALSTFEPPAPTQETQAAVAADLEALTHDIDIPLNARVLSFVQLFSGRLKGFLEEGLSRGAQFLPMIQDVFRAEGLPLDLAYVPLVESAFKPSALSRAKARGIWQFMQGTGLENGLKHDWYIDERADAEKATRAAAKYLKTLYATFGDWHLALASYNGGPGRVQRAIKRSGRDDFWKLSASTKFLPRETRDYVPLILAAVIIARNPAQYGLDVQPVEMPRFETITLPMAVDLRRIAEWIGTPVQAIQDLNPELRRWTTPVRAKDYELKVPEGTADMVREQLTQTEPTELASLNWHTVRKGETLLTISKKLKVNRADLAEANYLSAKAKVSTGQRLIIPRAPALLLAARTDSPEAPVTESRSVDVVDVVAASSVAPQALKTEEAAKLTYRVKAGDTLISIAKLYRTTVASLKSWNRLRGNSIQVGQRLTILTTRRVSTATN
jgi:membrane-bound lytic murein transglycosylase D